MLCIVGLHSAKCCFIENWNKQFRRIKFQFNSLRVEYFYTFSDLPYHVFDLVLLKTVNRLSPDIILFAARFIARTNRIETFIVALNVIYYLNESIKCRHIFNMYEFMKDECQPFVQ